MTTIIFEDEPLAADRLMVLLKTYDPDIVVKSVLGSIEDSLCWLKENPPVDFILADIQLADGSAFEIFRKITLPTPVIFTTAFDQYALDAFKLMSVDYLLKPVSAQALGQALDKLKKLIVGNFRVTINYDQVSELINGKSKYRTRFTGKSGSRLYFIDINEIGFFSVETKVVFLFKTDGNRYVMEYNMEQLEMLLDPTMFYRISRSVIVCISAVQHIKPYLNSMMKVILKAGIAADELLISRERVNGFIRWANR